MSAALRDRLWRLLLRQAYRAQRAYWFLFRPQIFGAYVAVWHDGKVLVVRNSYRRGLSFPAGGMRRGENPLQAAIRELGEEVGIAVAPEALHYVKEIVHRGGYAEDHAHFFELRCAEAPGISVDGREVVWAGFVAPEEARAQGVVSAVRIYLDGLP